jgi:hypothetical protein
MELVKEEVRHPQPPDLFLLPGDPAAEAAQATLHSGALVILFILAGTVLAPDVWGDKIDKEGASGFSEETV